MKYWHKDIYFLLQQYSIYVKQGVFNSLCLVNQGLNYKPVIVILLYFYDILFGVQFTDSSLPTNLML